MTDRIEAAARAICWSRGTETCHCASPQTCRAPIAILGVRLADARAALAAADASVADEAREMVDSIKHIVLSPCGIETMVKRLGQAAALIEKLAGLGRKG